MAIKLIALDIDGTLTNQLYAVSEKNRASVKHAEQAGIIVTLATGRGRIATRPIWKDLELHGPSIQFGGAMITDIDTERVIKLYELSPEVIREVLEFSSEIDARAQIYVDDVVILERMNSFAEGYIGRHHLPFVIDPDIRINTYHNVPKILVFAETGREEALFQMYRERFSGVAQVSRSNPHFIEINSLGVTKATALEDLSRMLGVPREEIAAVGDNYLDREMIEWAGLGVCMENGAEEVKAIADLIIPSCDEDGVSDFIEQIILQQMQS